MPNIYCKDCGKLLIYDGANIHVNTRDSSKLISSGLTFMSTRDFNGHIYHLCRCKECVAKKFPKLNESKFLYSQKAAKYTQYAFDVSDEDFYAFTKVRQSVTKEKMIAKYGDIEGLNKWESYCKKQAETNTFEYKAAKYGMTKDEFNEYNKNRACTKDLFIQRHGEVEGTKMWDAYCERQRYTAQPEYFIEKYGGAEGKKKYNDFCDKRINAGKQISQLHQSTSMIADELFSSIVKIFPNNKIWTHVTTLGEKIIKHKFAIDYYDETYNIVIEFYGDYWHMNPLIFNGSDQIPFNTKSKYLHTANDIWKHDKKRLEIISKSLGTNVIVIWENDYRKDKKNIINNILNLYKQCDNINL